MASSQISVPSELPIVVSYNDSLIVFSQGLSLENNKDFQPL